MTIRCRFKETFDACVVCSSNAKYILDRIGFGEKKCSETSLSDGRYGYWDYIEQALKYGFKDIHGVMMAGKLAVFDIDMPGSVDLYTEAEFEELFEVIE